MRSMIIVLSGLVSFPAWTHHTREHTMLMENPEQVIAATQQGAEGGGLWLLWGGVFFVLLLGLFRWWKGRS